MSKNNGASYFQDSCTAVIDYCLFGFGYAIQTLLISGLVLGIAQAIKEVIDERSTAGK
jgi:hypothetical protein